MHHGQQNKKKKKSVVPCAVGTSLSYLIEMNFTIQRFANPSNDVRSAKKITRYIRVVQLFFFWRGGAKDHNRYCELVRGTQL